MELLGGESDPVAVVLVGMAMTAAVGYLGSARIHDRVTASRLSTLRSLAEINEYAVNCVRRRGALASMELAKIKDEYAVWIDTGDDDMDLLAAADRRPAHGGPNFAGAKGLFQSAPVHPTLGDGEAPASALALGQMAESQLRQSLRQRLLNEAERAYRRMTSLYSRSPITFVVAAQFLSHAHKHRFFEMLYLERAAGLSSAPDIRFFIHQVNMDPSQLFDALVLIFNPPTPRAAASATVP